MNEKIKDNIRAAGTVILFAIIIFASGYITGRNRRLADISAMGDRSESTIIELQNRATSLESELSERIAELDRVQSELDRANSRLNECRGIVHQMRGDIEAAGSNNQKFDVYIRELRKRFDQLNDRIQQLEKQLGSDEGGPDK